MPLLGDWQGWKAYAWVDCFLVPFSSVGFLGHGAPRLANRLGKQFQLSGDEGRVVRVTGPGADVDDVESVVEEGGEGGELG